jgi:hypothetical protein
MRGMASSTLEAIEWVGDMASEVPMIRDSNQFERQRSSRIVSIGSFGLWLKNREHIGSRAVSEVWIFSFQRRLSANILWEMYSSQNGRSN